MFYERYGRSKKPRIDYSSKSEVRHAHPRPRHLHNTRWTVSATTFYVTLAVWKGSVLVFTVYQSQACRRNLCDPYCSRSCYCHWRPLLARGDCTRSVFTAFRRYGAKKCISHQNHEQRTWRVWWSHNCGLSRPDLHSCLERNLQGRCHQSSPRYSRASVVYPVSQKSALGRGHSLLFSWRGNFDASKDDARLSWMKFTEPQSLGVIRTLLLSPLHKQTFHAARLLQVPNGSSSPVSV